MVATLIACGIDPKKSILFVQSAVINSDYNLGALTYRAIMDFILHCTDELAE
jgi:tryptophanyl-tRNA synthetase